MAVGLQVFSPFWTSRVGKKKRRNAKSPKRLAGEGPLRKLPGAGELAALRPETIPSSCLGDVGELLAKEWKQPAPRRERTSASWQFCGQDARLSLQEQLAKACQGMISVQSLQASSGGGAFKSRSQSGHAGCERGGNQPRGLRARDRWSQVHQAGSPCFRQRSVDSRSEAKNPGGSEISSSKTRLRASNTVVYASTTLGVKIPASC